MQFRDPLHIDDLGRLMELLYEKRIYGQKIHAGGGKQNMISLLEFVRIANPEVKVEKMPGDILFKKIAGVIFLIVVIVRTDFG